MLLEILNKFFNHYYWYGYTKYIYIIYTFVARNIIPTKYIYIYNNFNDNYSSDI